MLEKIPVHIDINRYYQLFCHMFIIKLLKSFESILCSEMYLKISNVTCDTKQNESKEPMILYKDWRLIRRLLERQYFVIATTTILFLYPTLPHWMSDVARHSTRDTIQHTTMRHDTGHRNAKCTRHFVVKSWPTTLRQHDILVFTCHMSRRAVRRLALLRVASCVASSVVLKTRHTTFYVALTGFRNSCWFYQNATLNN